MDDGLRFGKQKNRRLTTAGGDAIITTGRDDALQVALPTDRREAAYQLALDGRMFLFLVFSVASSLVRGQDKKDNHADSVNSVTDRH